MGLERETENDFSFLDFSFRKNGKSLRCPFVYWKPFAGDKNLLSLSLSLSLSLLRERTLTSSSFHFRGNHGGSSGSTTRCTKRFNKGGIHSFAERRWRIFPAWDFSTERERCSHFLWLSRRIPFSHRPLNLFFFLAHFYILADGVKFQDWLFLLTRH